MISAPVMNPLKEQEEEASNYAMQLATACVLPMTLKVAIELNLVNIISRAGPGAQLLPEDIASQVPTENPPATAIIYRILRLLASYSILTCSATETNDGKLERRYGLAPVSRFLTPNEDGVSMASMVLFIHDKVLMESWYNLKASLLQGVIPFNKAHGMTTFDYAGIEPRFNELLNAAMADNSTITMKKMLELYQGFDGVEVLVDVGGGIGSLLNMIISKHTSIKGINFDLPHVIADAPTYVGVEHVGGDMFECVSSGDAIFMKQWILHSWNDELCLKLLRNCWKALPEKGKVIVMQGILPETPNTTTEVRSLFNLDILMLALTPGGYERTEKEYELLAKGAGFSGFFKVIHAFGFWIMEFHK